MSRLPLQKATERHFQKKRTIIKSAYYLKFLQMKLIFLCCCMIKVFKEMIAFHIQTPSLRWSGFFFSVKLNFAKICTWKKYSHQHKTHILITFSDSNAKKRYWDQPTLQLNSIRVQKYQMGHNIIHRNIYQMWFFSLGGFCNKYQFSCFRDRPTPSLPRSKI